ncbi:MAG: hypothetical protein HC913_23925 [Microscillaceae bacterium]|nr:hypothetical protein [Microscillaceae bacterium]
MMKRIFLFVWLIFMLFQVLACLDSSGAFISEPQVILQFNDGAMPYTQAYGLGRLEGITPQTEQIPFFVLPLDMNRDSVVFVLEQPGAPSDTLAFRYTRQVNAFGYTSCSEKKFSMDIIGLEVLPEATTLPPNTFTFYFAQ